MPIYLVEIATNNCEKDSENRAYKSLGSALECIYDNLRYFPLDEYEDGCDLFDRDYVKNYFTEEFFNRFSRVNCHSIYGELVINEVKDSKYQFVFIPSKEYLKSDIRFDNFIVCELEYLELLD